MTETRDSSADPDFGVETSEGTKAMAAAAEDEVLLRQMLGLHIPRTPNPQRLADQIALRIANTIDLVRHGLTQAQLQNTLNQNITDALARVQGITSRRPRGAPIADPEHAHRIRAIAAAVRESLPRAALVDIVAFGLPSVVPEDQNIPPHVIQFRCYVDGADRDVLIDTRHAFWREQEFADWAALQTKVSGSPAVSSLGIQIRNPPLPESYPLTAPDISAIFNAANTMSAIDLGIRYDNLTETVAVGGTNIDFSVNTANLVRLRLPAGTVLDGTPLLADTLIAGLTKTEELRDALLIQNVWNACVSQPNNSNPVPPDPATCALLAARIFTRLGSVPGAPLALRGQNILELQQEVAEQHRFFKRLREGSDNYAGAAFAATILMKYKDIRSVLGAAVTNIPEAERQRIEGLVSQLEGMSPPIEFGWDDLDTSLASIRAARAGIGGYSYGHPVTVDLLGRRETMTVPGSSGSPDHGAVLRWLDNFERDVQQYVAEYRKLATKMLPIVQVLRANGITGPSILVLFDPATNNPLHTQFIAGLDIPTYCREVRDSIGGGDLHGDRAQHEVIKEYLCKYHGATESEATDASKYIRARHYVDAELTRAAEEAAEDLYGDEVRLGTRALNWFENLKNVSFSPQWRAQTVIRNLASACGIPLSGNRPNWARAKSYESLATAYFAMKKLYEGGDGVPDRIRLQQTAEFQNHMREISRELLSRHAAALVRDFGPSLNLTDEKRRELMKEPNKAEHVSLLKQMLAGDPLDKDKRKIDKAIETADRRTEWFRRNVILGEKYGLVRGNKLPVSAKNLLYDNKYVSALGAAKGIGWAGKKVGRAGVGVVKGVARGVKAVTYDAPKAAVNTAWNHKGKIAAGVALTAMFGPAGLLAVGAYSLATGSQKKAA